MTGADFGLGNSTGADLQFSCMSVMADKTNYTDWTTCYNDVESLIFSKLPAGKGHESDFYSLNSTLADKGDNPAYVQNYNATLTLSASWVKDTDKVEEKCFSSTETSPASAILDEISRIKVDFCVWQFSFRRKINGQAL